MDINDILKRPEFKSLDNFLNKEMKKTAGNDLITEMKEVFEESINVIDWFYTSNIALGGSRPYDYCKDKKRDEVKNILGRIEYEVYS
ncbi:DUF2384 domain-containing protein [Candidatus Pacearchaeota archaeon]|nr:DUF2384 domain-containing protein [Candidatus Pacearchaeota archaeon]